MTERQLVNVWRHGWQIESAVVTFPFWLAFRLLSACQSREPWPPWLKVPGLPFLIHCLMYWLPEIQPISNVSPGGSPSALSFWFTFTFTVYRSLEIRSRNMYTLKLSSPSCHTMHDTMHDMWNIAWHSSLPIDLQTKEKHARHKSQCHARVLQ